METALVRRVVGVAVAVLVLFAVPSLRHYHWNRVPSANQTLPDGVLASASCASAEACVAVGSYTNASDNVATLAESWNGTAWSLQSTPNPTGTKLQEPSDIEFSGVSCASSAACLGVGAYDQYGASWGPRRRLERRDLVDRVTADRGQVLGRVLPVGE